MIIARDASLLHLLLTALLAIFFAEDPDGYTITFHTTQAIA